MVHSDCGYGYGYGTGGHSLGQGGLHVPGLLSSRRQALLHIGTALAQLRASERGSVCFRTRGCQRPVNTATDGRSLSPFVSVLIVFSVSNSSGLWQVGVPVP
jgi:hypothetical protein